MTGREYILSKLTNEQLASALFELDLGCSECPIHTYCDKRHGEIIEQLKIKYPNVDPDPKEAEEIYFENAFNELGCDETYLEFMNKEDQNA